MPQAIQSRLRIILWVEEYFKASSGGKEEKFKLHLRLAPPITFHTPPHPSYTPTPPYLSTSLTNLKGNKNSYLDPAYISIFMLTQPPEAGQMMDNQGAQEGKERPRPQICIVLASFKSQDLPTHLSSQAWWVAHTFNPSPWAEADGSL